MKYKLQLLTEEWKIKRLSILQRDKFKCRKCGSKNKLHVHHKIYEKGLMAWEAENKNLITLCFLCHEAEHAKKPISSFFIKKIKTKNTKIDKLKNKINLEMKKSRIQQLKYNDFG